MYENVKLKMKIVAVRKLVSKGKQNFAVVLVVYGSNDKMSRMWQK